MCVCCVFGFGTRLIALREMAKHESTQVIATIETQAVETRNLELD